MEKLRVRCPSCAKLYEVNESDIKTHEPQFDCVACPTRFTFAFPVAHRDNIETFLVLDDNGEPALSSTVAATAASPATFQQELEAQTFAALQQELEDSAEKNGTTNACPKCGALNNKKSKECYACHVLFERLEDMPLDPTLRAQPSLVRKWKNLILNFENMSLHDDFLNSCHQMEALRFAILKYEELKSAQGGTDDICERMIFKAHGLLQVSLASKTNGQTFQLVKEKTVPSAFWHKYVLLTPLVISILMILTGFFSIALRNLVGAGVAVMLLTFGLTLLWKGRISLSDFLH